MRHSPFAAAALAAALGLAGCALRRPLVIAPALDGPSWREAAPERLRQATVTIERDGRPFCAGALAVRSDLVVTAWHCLPLSRTPRLGHQVRLADGTREEAALAAADPESDLALLQLPEPAGLPPLPVADSGAFQGGEDLFFLGRADPDRQVQQALVRGRDACPDLPGIADAIFSSHAGKPGDSGAVLVGRRGIVGVVHGGVHCNIAIPSSAIERLAERALGRGQASRP